MQHLLTINALDRKQLTTLLDNAQDFILPNGQCVDQPLLAGKTVISLFCENSTRTRCSFELAAKKLSAHVINLDMQTSSSQKGEALLDTIAILQAMGGDYFVLRHGEAGIMDSVAGQLAPSSHLINAGEGCTAHPTQALIDMLTIRQHKAQFADLRVVIVGDSRHSRVARSQIAALRLLGVQDICLIGSAALLPSDSKPLGVSTCESLVEGMVGADVVSVLRIQHERLQGNENINLADYVARYCLTPEQLARAKSDAIVLHPGPMNRGIEISGAVADGGQSCVLQQVRNGIAVRMAVLAWLRDNDN